MTYEYSSDGSASRAARDAGLEQVLENQSSNWKADYAYYAEKFLDERRFNDLFTGEDLRPTPGLHRIPMLGVLALMACLAVGSGKSISSCTTSPRPSR